MIKAILFDFDGTLVNSLPMYLRAYTETLKSYNFNFTDSKIITKCFGKTEEEITQSLGISDQAHEFRIKYFEFIKILSPEIKLFPDTINVLEWANKKNLELAIITFMHRWYIDSMLDKFQIRNLFQSILSFNDVKKAKPDPEAVIKSCQTLKVEISDSLVVGDSKGDMLMGKNAGAKTALFLPEENKNFYDFEKLKQTKPDYAIGKLIDLKRLF